ncbi:C6 finger domain protein [Lepidopterella palustris CBS 459.81]|uniref:C6 finger domain protein n=1 Tax=Lepidopterella palustris CBS 459.81 TaxID=1314670 RepID=A0A8E2JF92_9PEZI|nr:C6 finger domain protein [Lepidopterella palustris CBS 459.81]
MDNLDLPNEAFLAFDNYDPNPRFPYLHSSTWPMPLDHQTMSHGANANAQSRRINTTSATSSSQPSATAAPLQQTGLGYHQQAMNPSNLLTDWFQLQPSGQSYNQDTGLSQSDYTSYGGPLQTSPVDFNLSTSQAMMNTTLSMDGTTSFIGMSAPMDMNQMTAPFQMADFQQELLSYLPSAGNDPTSTELVSSSVAGSSPTENWLEVRSLSSSDNGWTNVDFAGHRHSFDYNDGSNAIFINPNQTTLHIRTNSDSSQQSDVPRSAHSFSSYEEIQFPLNSPQSEIENNLDFSQQMTHGLPHYHDYDGHFHSHSHSPNHSSSSVSPQTIPVEPLPIKQSGSSSTSPTSSAMNSPPGRRRKSPVGAKVAKTIVKKTPTHSTKKDHVTEKRVGRRRGPLRPDQRQQAHEIRKLRACLRCKFLKKTCDKGDPCGGCQPAHARLWQVPCTRIDIKDIAYFMKDWKADFERHVSLGFSVGNIKGFSPQERPLYITHGYGHFLPINAREVYVRDDKCFGVDWVETMHEKPKEFEVNTAKLSAGMEGVSHTLLSEYLDRHIDGGFERFVDEYFEGTYFLTEILKTAYRYYLREKLPVIRKALKLVLAYNLTLHVTMVEGLSEDEAQIGKVDDNTSKFCGKTVAPVMINFQVKCALADMWRELQKDVLEELSALYSSVYSGDKLKNWPTIFMLAAILLAVWELMQFDCHYRVPDQAAVQKFCSDMESTPVGVIVGLFSAISQKLPSFSEWDSRKHHHLLNSNPAVCDAMTEVRAHVSKYETYLKSRSETKFDRNDFDSLSNKFLSKLVIRAN